jgi:23S rRNA G2069 N7-methylase RlmK/C1962 C5-methylase RlmI
MSVLKNKRSLSKLEFYHNARKLRKDITNLLLRDFGVRDKIRTIKTEGEEKQIIEEFPDWLIIQFRTSIMNILRNLMMNLTAGNTIYPVNMEELADRRHYQNAAIINCEQLLQELMYCEEVLPTKVSSFLPFIESVAFEIKLLKGWRKSSNAFEKKLKVN